MEKEIQQENNVILQCLRYIVDQNYFRIGEPVGEALASEEICDTSITLVEQPKTDQNVEAGNANQSTHEAILVTTEIKEEVCEDVPEPVDTVMSDQENMVDREVPDQPKACELPK